MSGHKGRRRAAGLESGPTAVGITNPHNAGSTANASSYTFSSVDCGDDDVNRKIAVVYAVRANSGTTFEVTLDGNAKDAEYEANSGDSACGISIFDYPSGSLVDVVVTPSKSSQGCAISVYRYLSEQTGAGSVHDTDTQSGGTQTNTVNIAEQGGHFSVLQTKDSSITWGNASADYDFDTDTSDHMFAGHATDLSLETNRNITTGISGSARCMVTVSVKI